MIHVTNIHYLNKNYLFKNKTFCLDYCISCFVCLFTFACYAKSFTVAILFVFACISFLRLFPSTLDWTDLSFVTQKACDQDRTHSLYTLENVSVKIVPQVVVPDIFWPWYGLFTVTRFHSIQKKHKKQPETWK